MSRGEHIYSRFVAWLKIILPFGALILLSTIFLFSRGSDPVSQIPLLENGVDPGSSEQVSGPVFSGTTEAGHALTVEARQARAGDEGLSHLVADDLRAVVDLEDGSRVSVEARTGQLSQDIGKAEFGGGVIVTSSTGYTARTDGMRLLTGAVDMESTGPVDAKGPAGTLEAGKLRVQEDPVSGDVQLLFTEGVKLVYTPQSKGTDK